MLLITDDYCYFNETHRRIIVRMCWWKRFIWGNRNSEGKRRYRGPDGRTRSSSEKCDKMHPIYEDKQIKLHYLQYEMHKRKMSPVHLLHLHWIFLPLLHSHSLYILSASSIQLFLLEVKSPKVCLYIQPKAVKRNNRSIWSMLICRKEVKIMPEINRVGEWEVLFDENVDMKKWRPLKTIR